MFKNMRQNILKIRLLFKNCGIIFNIHNLKRGVYKHEKIGFCGSGVLRYLLQAFLQLAVLQKLLITEAPKAYGYVYTADPETLDHLVSGKQSTKVATSNGIDGLFTNDKYGNLDPCSR